MSEFLSKDELEDMTGLTQPAAQRRLLEADGLKKGIHFFIRADGQIRLLRAGLTARLMPPRKAPPGPIQPNFDGLPSLR